MNWVSFQFEVGVIRGAQGVRLVVAFRFVREE
jgi:hypothetical protein